MREKDTEIIINSMGFFAPAQINSEKLREQRRLRLCLPFSADCEIPPVWLQPLCDRRNASKSKSLPLLTLPRWYIGPPPALCFPPRPLRRNTMLEGPWRCNLAHPNIYITRPGLFYRE